MMGDSYEVRQEKVIKNNHVTYDGLVIMKKGEHVAPTACLNDFYNEYNQGHNITDIALSIIVWYEQYNRPVHFAKLYQN